MAKRTLMAATVTMAAATLSGCASTAQMVNADRDDCPGQIICPLTGKPVCIDRCPVGAGAAVAKEDVAVAVAQPGSCCQEGE